MTTENKLRSLGWWQPFGSLMLPPHNKIETRIPSITASGIERKLPFPNGDYLIYTTQKETSKADLYNWCGIEVYSDIIERMRHEPTSKLRGYAIGIGTLMGIRDMQPDDWRQCFITYSENRKCLLFENVRRIEPFKYEYGKQGVGFVPESEMEKIKFI